MAVYKINESVEEVKKESTKAEEAATNDYRVVTVAMDLAMPADKRLRDYGPIGQGNNGKLFKALVSALESVGLEMAGDYVDELSDVTDVYKENDYEFEFEESLKEDLGTDIDEYQQWVDYDMKRYGKISDQTNKEIKEAGLQVVKDKYGDYQVIAGKYDESLKESDSTARNFTVEDADGDTVDYQANSAKEAIEKFKKSNPGTEIMYVYDEGDIYYDPDDGEELDY